MLRWIRKKDDESRIQKLMHQEERIRLFGSNYKKSITTKKHSLDKFSKISLPRSQQKLCIFRSRSVETIYILSCEGKKSASD